MSFYSPVNSMGQNRSTMIQQAAQTAAQNVMRRQKLRTMLGKTVAGGGGATMGSPLRAQNLGKPIGTAGGISRPGGVIGGGQSLQQQLAAALGFAQTPSAYNASGGGADFSSVPDPADGHQSPQTLPNQGVAPHQISTAPSLMGSPPPGTPGFAPLPASGSVGSWVPSPSQIASQLPPAGGGTAVSGGGQLTPGGAPTGGIVGTPGAGAGAGTALANLGSPGAIGALIPLGSNLFYDPGTDSVIGSPGTPGNSGATGGSASRAS